MRYTLSELEDLPTLSVSQADNLKVDTGSTRVWLCRCGLEDGAPYAHTVTVERLTDGRWETVETYGADRGDEK